MEKTDRTLNPKDFQSFLKENSELFYHNSKQSSVTLKSGLNTLHRLLLHANVENNLKSKEHSDYLAQTGGSDWNAKLKLKFSAAHNSGFLNVDNVLAVVMPHHLSLRVK